MASQSQMLNIEFFTKNDLNQAKRFNFSPTLHHFHDFYGNIMCLFNSKLEDFSKLSLDVVFITSESKQSGFKKGCSAKF